MNDIILFSKEIMSHIAAGLPDEQRGAFSTSLQAREAAAAVSEFPFETPEHRGT